MNTEKNYPIITISREYAAGGRTIAKALSAELGLEWYDRDFMIKTAEESGYSFEDILKEGEEVSQASVALNNILNSAASYKSSYDAIFEAQKKTILELAQTPCIIVGRCSNIILREAGIASFDIFLTADDAFRFQRASELGETEATGDSLRKYIEKRDKLRSTYYHHYTHHEFGNYHDYDIMLNIGRIGWENATAQLANIIRRLP